MLKFLFIFLVAVPVLAAQSVVTIPPQQCVWRAGDDLSWAASNLNDSGWQPYSTWKLDPSEPRIWIRCHADLSTLRDLAQPAVQIRLYSAYGIYLNGQFLGSAGNLKSGDFSMNSIRTYPAPAIHFVSGPSTLALRIARNDPVTNSGPLLGLIASGIEVRAGDQATLDALRSNVVLDRSSRYTASALCFGIIGVVAIMLLGLYLSDRSRPELLLLSLTCLGVSLLRLNEFCAASLLNFSIRICLALIVVGNLTHSLTKIPFFYALARRRMPPLVWALLALSVLAFVPSAISIFRFPGQWASLEPFNSSWFRPSSMAINGLLSLVPFFAFWPYSQIGRRIRPLAVLCMLWGVADFVWFVVEITGTPLPGLPNLFATWGQTLLEVRAFATAGVLASLLGLLFREQRQAVEERAMLTGEMASAREIQQYLIPEKLPQTPGLTIESVYRPSREVGGDFFQVLPDPRDGSTLIVVGDVAGKGLQAGMLATLIVGAIRTAFEFTSDPGRILALLNERLQGRGLVTCLAMRIDSSGNAEIANAGQIPPFVSGKDLALEGALPLGALPNAAFPVTSLQLDPGQPILLVSDGVVEARNAAGELFGFERTAAISTESAESIARAASTFGQEDDITVLTLTRLTVAPETASAPTLRSHSTGLIQP